MELPGDLGEARRRRSKRGCGRAPRSVQRRVRSTRPELCDDNPSSGNLAAGESESTLERTETIREDNRGHATVAIVLVRAEARERASCASDEFGSSFESHGFRIGSLSIRPLSLVVVNIARLYRQSEFPFVREIIPLLIKQNSAVCHDHTSLVP